MNIIRNSFSQLFSIRQHLPATVRLFSSASVETSSPINNEIPPASEPELDKLFKKINLEIKGNDVAVLKSYVWFATEACKHLGVEVGKSWSERKARKQRWTVLKSRHVHKKHKVQYEIRTYFKFMDLHRLTGSTSDTLLEYLERNLPEGVAMKVTKTEIQELPEYLHAPPNSEEKS